MLRYLLSAKSFKQFHNIGMAHKICDLTRG
mgnify:CR=1 FL=1